MTNLESAETTRTSEAFCKAAERYAEADRAKNYSVSDECADELYQLTKSLRHDFGRQGRALLANFTSHPDDQVKSIAAAASLDFNTENSEAILEHLAQRPGMQGFTAEIALKEWRAGRKEFPGGPVKPDELAADST